ncbi:MULTISPECIES: serine hydrolase [Brevibacterium]|uniref:CubicO group peptidase, beta-lactamase class C family n=2 Tax=Brevibacterium antiquum TaxID=234835 RepID=A0A2H1KPC7_9MICO|nr:MULTISPECIES: serine hydrolase [Brevibacterium]SMY01254.1 CubicO group peptidase, beta-lactamase class C family [Brevibacterium antiquum]SMY01610.1 CubicO group peptidase, beta-lactamase class C family [Brevibacterium antiquum CNRZ 918]HCG56079.1 serine hydrolase [Brevibacterium sp.]
MADWDKTLPGSVDESGVRRVGALSGNTKGIATQSQQTGDQADPGEPRAAGVELQDGSTQPPADPAELPTDGAEPPSDVLPLPRAGDLTSASEDAIVDPSEAILERIDLDSWKWPEYFAFSLTRMEELFPVGGIPRGIGPVRDLVTEENDFRPVPIDREKWSGADKSWSTVGDVLADTFTDAWLVARDGVALAEEYAWPMKPARQHMLFSISKSIVSAVIGALTDAGHLSPDDLVTTRVPALSKSGYAGATIRDLLDMRSGIKFSEEYLKEGSEIRALFEAVDFAPRTATSAHGIKNFLMGLSSEREHGGPFVYRSCETDVLAWICESVVGQPFSVIASEYVWSKIGAAHAAQVCQDRWGGSIADGAISSTLRDLARFGEMIARGGTTAEGERVLSGQWIDDIFTGAADSAQVFADSPSGRSYPGGMYRSQFWVPSASRDVVIGIGIHGQMLYIDRATQTVGVKLSSDPQPVSLAHQHGTLAMFEAIAEAVPRTEGSQTVPPAVSDAAAASNAAAAPAAAAPNAAAPNAAVPSAAAAGTIIPNVAAPAAAAPSIAPQPFAAQPGIF